MNSKIGLLLCSQTKKDYACSAKEIYNDSPAFRARRIFIEFLYDEWYVMTSKYGFCAPNQVIEPYSWYITTNTRFMGKDNDTETMTDDMVDEWIEKLKTQMDGRLDIHMDCHFSGNYYKQMKKVFPNAKLIKQQKVIHKTAWKYHDATMMLLNGESIRAVFDFLNEPEPEAKRHEEKKWFYHNEHEPLFGMSSDVSKKYGVNDFNIWSVSMGDSVHTQGWTIDKSLLPYITKVNNKYRIEKGMSKKNTNMERPDIKPHLDKLEELINGRHYNDILGQVDSIYEMLDSKCGDRDDKIWIYEESLMLINEHFPNHNLTDDMLECITYEWLEQ